MGSSYSLMMTLPALKRREGRSSNSSMGLLDVSKDHQGLRNVFSHVGRVSRSVFVGTGAV